LFIILFTFILLKIYIAILEGQFTDLTESGAGQDKIGFFELIIRVVVEKYASDEEVKLTPIPPKAGKCTKWRITLINRLLILK
jgi:hypothetical protein